MSKQDNFWKDKAFIWILVITGCVFLSLSLPIFLCLDEIAAKYPAIIESFELPFKALYAGFAIAGFYAVVYRIEQTHKQIAMTANNDNFSQYLKHRDYIFGELDNMTESRDCIKQIDNRKFYNLLFKRNTHTTFTVCADTDETNSLIASFKQFIYYFHDQARDMDVNDYADINRYYIEFIKRVRNKYLDQLAPDLAKHGISLAHDYFNVIIDGHGREFVAAKVYGVTEVLIELIILSGNERKNELADMQVYAFNEILNKK